MSNLSVQELMEMAELADVAADEARKSGDDAAYEKAVNYGLEARESLEQFQAPSGIAGELASTADAGVAFASPVTGKIAGGLAGIVTQVGEFLGLADEV